MNKSPHQSPQVVMPSHHMNWYLLIKEKNACNDVEIHPYAQKAAKQSSVDQKEGQFSQMAAACEKVLFHHESTPTRVLHECQVGAPGRQQQLQPLLQKALVFSALHIVCN
jgi:hypothetical protein